MQFGGSRLPARSKRLRSLRLPLCGLCGRPLGLFRGLRRGLCRAPPHSAPFVLGSHSPHPIREMPKSQSFISPDMLNKAVQEIRVLQDPQLHRVLRNRFPLVWAVVLRCTRRAAWSPKIQKIKLQEERTRQRKPDPESRTNIRQPRAKNSRADGPSNGANRKKVIFTQI